MRALPSDLFDRWIRGTAIVALAILAWAVFVPDGLFWPALLAAGLSAAVVATGVLVGRRKMRATADVIASAEPQPLAAPAGCGYAGGTGDRPSPRGERKP